LSGVHADETASSTSIGLHREILEAIEGKFIDIDSDDLAWPTLDGKFLKDTSRPPIDVDQDAEEDATTDPALVEYWDGVRTRHQTRSYLSPDGPSYDLSVLPKTWAIVSISVTEDRNTMFISRHQNGHDPLVFCLPLDRQSKREGEEEDVFTFDAGITELKTIIRLSEECSKKSKFVQTDEDKAEWWRTKWELDGRMKELVNNVEFCWLGAFKVSIFAVMGRETG
jgi:separase